MHVCAKQLVIPGLVSHISYVCWGSILSLIEVLFYLLVDIMCLKQKRIKQTKDHIEL